MIMQRATSLVQSGQYISIKPPTLDQKRMSQYIKNQKRAYQEKLTSYFNENFSSNEQFFQRASQLASMAQTKGLSNIDDIVEQYQNTINQKYRETALKSVRSDIEKTFGAAANNREDRDSIQATILHDINLIFQKLFFSKAASELKKCLLASAINV